MQRSTNRSFRDRNNLKPKVVVVSLLDYNDWRKKLVDKIRFNENFNKQSEWITMPKEPL